MNCDGHARRHASRRVDSGTYSGTGFEIVAAECALLIGEGGGRQRYLAWCVTTLSLFDNNDEEVARSMLRS